MKTQVLVPKQIQGKVVIYASSLSLTTNTDYGSLLKSLGVTRIEKYDNTGCICNIEFFVDSGEKLTELILVSA